MLRNLSLIFIGLDYLYYCVVVIASQKRTLYKKCPRQTQGKLSFSLFVFYSVCVRAIIIMEINKQGLLYISELYAYINKSNRVRAHPKKNHPPSSQQPPPPILHLYIDMLLIHERKQFNVNNVDPVTHCPSKIYRLIGAKMGICVHVI